VVWEKFHSRKEGTKGGGHQGKSKAGAVDGKQAHRKAKAKKRAFYKKKCPNSTVAEKKKK